MVFILILTISIITGFTQILSSLSDLKDSDPNKKGIGKITKAGWLFYVCAIILSILPGIQKLAQDDVDDEQRIKNDLAQDKRDSILRANYDSSLLVMKSKFDTTTAIVSATLGKYGYKLDEANMRLISLGDSVKKGGTDPVLQLTYPPDPQGIILLEKSLEEESKFAINIASIDAGSSRFHIKYSFVLEDSVHLSYYPPDTKDLIDPQLTIAKDQISRSYHYIPIRDNHILLFIWVRGDYKRVDGTGNFYINNVYCYNIRDATTTLVFANTRKRIIDLINNFEK
jgi:hypothetical protein